MAHVANRGSGNPNAALVICPNPEMLAELLPLLARNMAGLAVHPFNAYPEYRSLNKTVSELTPVLCFLDMESDFDAAQRLVTALAGSDSPVPAVALLGSCDSDLILRCLRKGATEFLTRPFSAAELDPVLARLCQLAAKKSHGGGARVVCVAPAKGACGASTIAANLAYQRKTLGAKKMLLADLDPFTGIISFLLKVKSNYSFLDALTRSTTLDADLWKGMVTSREGLDILPSPENPLDSVQDLDDPTPMIEFARQYYDTIIIDCASPVGDWGLAVTQACDELLLVTTNELPALQATQKIFAYFERNRVERAKVRLVVNRFNKQVGLSKETITTALHSDIYHLLPSDYEAVHKALMDGKPIPANSAFGKSLVGLAHRLSGREEAKVHAKPKASWMGLFSTVFSRASK
ncbi:MAG: AAA family ATPase [Bryobacteraceae bacterium]|nr:AAA family ATPase [Bryobacteraceae bacterium]